MGSSERRWRRHVCSNGFTVITPMILSRCGGMGTSTVCLSKVQHCPTSTTRAHLFNSTSGGFTSSVALRAVTAAFTSSTDSMVTKSNPRHSRVWGVLYLVNDKFDINLEMGREVIT